MKAKNVSIELKNGTQARATVDFYIEALSSEEAVGNIEEIIVKWDDSDEFTDEYYVEVKDLTEESLDALQSDIDDLAMEHANEYWYEQQGADAYDDAKDARYDD